ncbi:hypothetical protein CBQ28_02205 [Pseudoalteromonas sp. GCY]|uniref:hypothetical protein n=1 Tax=Pseudoalteromonas sp. GCY TaxID=2003316 RepID=UPI000BFED479|nr:hypothetical protein [Pseudoalteromonas sp. GCY]PHI38843.1 hypothetical protein CBQ28_02205 [Pseudoalteromonas sp. GCY]QQQ65939.1 hypothetical protein JJQ94_16700 [Pseudoalteromonas sp. GCY]
MFGAMLGATGAIPGMTNGAGSPISSGATSGTGDQMQRIGFQGGNINFGGGTNNQFLIIGAVAIAALFLLKK